MFVKGHDHLEHLTLYTMMITILCPSMIVRFIIFYYFHCILYIFSSLFHIAITCGAMRWPTRERSHIHARNVGKPSHASNTSIDITKLTRGSTIGLSNVRSVRKCSSELIIETNIWSVTVCDNFISFCWLLSTYLLSHFLIVPKSSIFAVWF